MPQICPKTNKKNPTAKIPQSQKNTAQNSPQTIPEYPKYPKITQNSSKHQKNDL